MRLRRRALPTVRSGSGSAAGGESEQHQHQRQRAPQATAPSRSASGHVSSQVVPPEFQRRIIDSIRNEDTRTLLDSIENGCMCSVIVIVIALIQPRHAFTSAFLLVNMFVAMCDLLEHIHASNTYVSSAVEIDVNFLDDVGQSLLNWASAFGTEEMVSLHELRIAY